MIDVREMIYKGTELHEEAFFPVDNEINIFVIIEDTDAQG